MIGYNIYINIYIDIYTHTYICACVCVIIYINKVPFPTHKIHITEQTVPTQSNQPLQFAKPNAPTYEYIVREYNVY